LVEVRTITRKKLKNEGLEKNREAVADERSEQEHEHVVYHQSVPFYIILGRKGPGTLTSEKQEVEPHLKGIHSDPI
jgi:hypothetical protein